MNWKLLAAFVLVTLGVFLQLFVGEFFGIWLNLTLAALISLSFVCGLWEILFLTLTALFMLNWQPAPSTEIITLGVMPISAFFIRRTLPFEPWAGVLILTFIGVLILYLLFGASLIVTALLVFGGDEFFSLLYAAMVLKTMVYLFPQANQTNF